MLSYWVADCGCDGVYMDSKNIISIVGVCVYVLYSKERKIYTAEVFDNFACVDFLYVAVDI